MKSYRSQVSLEHDMTPTRVQVEKHSIHNFVPKPQKINILKNTTSNEFACIPDPSRVYKKTTKTKKEVNKKKQFFDADKHMG
jgi:hypothetical protein